MSKETPIAAGRSWRSRLIVGLVIVVLLVLAYVVAVTFLPRWWAQRVGDLVDGRFGAGTAWGLFYGIVFTFVPLVIARQALRRVEWTTRIIFLTVAAALATPNLMTLGIVLGRGKAAHAGERILDVTAPAFRGASLIGAIIATIVALGIFALIALGRQSRRELKQLRDDQKQRDSEARDRAEEGREDPVKEEQS